MLLNLSNDLFNEILKYLTLKETFKLLFLSKDYIKLIENIDINIKYDFENFKKLANFDTIKNIKYFKCHIIDDKDLNIIGNNNKNIQYLDLSESLVSSNLHIIYRNNLNLNHLNLNYTFIDDLTLKNLSKYIKKLSYLNISNTFITDKAIQYISNMNIKHLEIENTHIFNINLRNLEKINIANTFLDEHQINKLLKKNNIKYIDVRGIKISYLAIYTYLKTYRGLTIII